jgi:hypothetical protein
VHVCVLVCVYVQQSGEMLTSSPYPSSTKHHSWPRGCLCKSISIARSCQDPTERKTSPGDSPLETVTGPDLLNGWSLCMSLCSEKVFHLLISCTKDQGT